MSEYACFLSSTGGDQVMRNFAHGLKIAPVHINDFLSGSLEPKKYNIVWGILRGYDKLIEYCKENNKNYIYVDHSYILARGESKGQRFRVTRNSAQAIDMKPHQSERWKMLERSIQSWRSEGKNIVICPPTPAMCSYYKLQNWTNETIKIIKQHSNRPIVIRMKPNEVNVLEKEQGIWPIKIRNKKNINQRPLNEELEDAFCVVTFNSNVAVEALLNGVPAFVSKYSIAAPVCETDLSKIETPKRIDLQPWLNHIAYSQFSANEIRSGMLWRYV